MPSESPQLPWPEHSVGELGTRFGTHLRRSHRPEFPQGRSFVGGPQRILLLAPVNRRVVGSSPTRGVSALPPMREPLETVGQVCRRGPEGACGAGSVLGRDRAPGRSERAARDRPCTATRGPLTRRNASRWTTAPSGRNTPRPWARAMSRVMLRPVTTSSDPNTRKFSRPQISDGRDDDRSVGSCSFAFRAGQDDRPRLPQAPRPRRRAASLPRRRKPPAAPRRQGGRRVLRQGAKPLSPAPLQARTATELLDRAGGIKSVRVAPAELERWLTSEGLAEVVDGRLVPTPRAKSLVDSLGGPDRRGDGVRRATRIA